MALRPCLTCGRPTRGTRCPDHWTPPSRHVYNSAAYQLERAAMLSTATTCHWCGEPPTPNDPLTADHDPPLASTVGEWHGRLLPAHRSCNSRRCDGAIARANPVPRHTERPA